MRWVAIGMDTETFVRSFLQEFGLTVKRVSEVYDEERADYRANDDKTTYVVEVKDKYDAESVLAEYHAKIDAGKVFVRSESTGYKNAVSNVFNKADSQLASTAVAETDIRVVWLQLAGIDRDLQFQQTISTIYGTVQLLPIGPTVVTKDCYYFNYNVVYRNRGVDAIIICDGDAVLLATNPFSPRFGQFQSTRLYQQFAAKQCAVNPVELERDGEIYVADCPISRRDSTAVLQYLQIKYNVDRFLDLQPTSTTASVAVRRHPDSDRAE